MPSLAALRIIIPSLLAGVASAALLAASFIQPSYVASLQLTPTTDIITLGDTFTVSVLTSATAPINVWQGVITFDPDKLEVASISYNTSVADLWAEEPWYSNGAGTLNFIGGTTKSGGFTGEGSLLTITFHSLNTGDANVRFNEKHILKHDGLGTEVPLAGSIDHVFSIIREDSPSLATSDTDKGSYVAIVPETVSTDLNNDGRQNIIDTSIFMTHLATGNLKADFNQDGSVDTRDLSIILNAK